MFKMLWFLLFGFFIGLIPTSNAQKQKIPPPPQPEAAFRRALRKWRSTGDYQPWMELADQITDAATSENRLEWIGAVEESILTIEKATLHQGEHVPRDVALSKLYETYGYALHQLSPNECLALAQDPHTLLIGADTVTTPSVAVCVENAENALRNSVSLDATNLTAEKLLETILLQQGGQADNVHKRKPKEFVAELFDSFADTFDEKLLKRLQYRVPKLIGSVVQSLLVPQQQQQYTRALDAGCGTGLAGRYLRPLVSGQLIGVDASPKMLDIASHCTLHQGCGLETLNETERAQLLIRTNDATLDQPLYNKLLAMDLESMTIENTLGEQQATSTTNGFDLIVAADVLVYFGNLETLMQVFANVSKQGARLVVSCEHTLAEQAPLGWRLMPTGRFAHTAQHVEEVARKAGYKSVLYQEIVPRMEKGDPVRGHLFAFQLVTTSSTNNDHKEEL